GCPEACASALQTSPIAPRRSGLTRRYRPARTCPTAKPPIVKEASVLLHVKSIQGERLFGALVDSGCFQRSSGYGFSDGARRLTLCGTGSGQSTQSTRGSN